MNRQERYVVVIQLKVSTFEAGFQIHGLFHNLVSCEAQCLHWDRPHVIDGQTSVKALDPVLFVDVFERGHSPRTNAKKCKIISVI